MNRNRCFTVLFLAAAVVVSGAAGCARKPTNQAKPNPPVVEDDDPNRLQPAALLQPAPAPRGDTAPPGPQIRLNQKSPDDLKATFEVFPLDDSNRAKLAKVEWTPEQWQQLFAVYANRTGLETPPTLGTYRVVDRALRFEPKFPLTPGVRYQAVFHPAKLPVPPTAGAEPVEAAFPIARSETPSTTTIVQVYPTRPFLPENQLKFYIHFSAPMSRGEAYQHIRLYQLHAKGKGQHVQIERPFLEIGEELWDLEGKRFTLLFDPGRIKRGLKPREEMGPALLEGKEYALAIALHWKDANGKPLTEAFRKEFKVLPPDDTCPDPKTWKVVPPPAAAVLPVVIHFPEPMDQALLHSKLWVVDAKGKKRPGTVKVAGQEVRWEFEPDDPWEVGKYEVVVDTTLEDLAGNNLLRPFEVDVFKKVDREVKTETIKLPFEVPIPGKEK